MSVDTTVDGVPSKRASRLGSYLDWLQMLSGLFLVLFMWAHMLLVGSVIISPDIMNAIAWFFEETYMAQVGGPLIGLIFLAHFVVAARKIPFRSEGQRRMWAQAKSLKHRDTWLWIVQAVSAMIILIMGAIHLWVVLTDLPITAAKSAERIQGGFWMVFYLILLPMVELHVSVGFYRIGVKWGFITSENRPAAKRIENWLIGIFITIGVVALLRFYFLAI